MLDRIRRRLTYANVMATIAVFGVLAAGGAYAASKIGTNQIKDPWGVVHLKGVIDGGTNDTVFTLPPGYRPSRNLLVVIHRQSGPSSLIVRADGTLAPLLGPNNASLDGVRFRAGE